jgi:hypothetical protein
VQLQNPLHAMMGSVAVLEAGSVPPEELQWYLGSLCAAVDAMFCITRNVLDLFALSLGKLPLRESGVNVRGMIEMCARHKPNHIKSIK